MKIDQKEINTLAKKIFENLGDEIIETICDHYGDELNDEEAGPYFGEKFELVYDAVIGRLISILEDMYRS